VDDAEGRSALRQPSGNSGSFAAAGDSARHPSGRSATDPAPGLEAAAGTEGVAGAAAPEEVGARGPARPNRGAGCGRCRRRTCCPGKRTRRASTAECSRGRRRNRRRSGRRSTRRPRRPRTRPGAHIPTACRGGQRRPRRNRGTRSPASRRSRPRCSRNTGRESGCRRRWACTRPENTGRPGKTAPARNLRSRAQSRTHPRSVRSRPGSTSDLCMPAARTRRQRTRARRWKSERDRFRHRAGPRSPGPARACRPPLHPGPWVSRLANRLGARRPGQEAPWDSAHTPRRRRPARRTSERACPDGSVPRGRSARRGPGGPSGGGGHRFHPARRDGPCRDAGAIRESPLRHSSRDSGITPRSSGVGDS
jgi:hypothetical protein